MTVFDYETLTKLGARLFDHADSSTNVARHDMEVDCRLAARVCGNMATLRFRIMEIAEAALTQPGTAIRRELLDAGIFTGAVAAYFIAAMIRHRGPSVQLTTVLKHGKGPAHHRPFFIRPTEAPRCGMGETHAITFDQSIV